MRKREPKKLLAPIVIAGITVGFLMSAYKFIFAKPEVEAQEKSPEHQENMLKNSDKK